MVGGISFTFEGFGLTAAKPMSAGLLVIASNIDGLAEVEQDGMVKPGYCFR
jgi:glycosyltransferase involved in cell wall biosynthesis